MRRSENRVRMSRERIVGTCEACSVAAPTRGSRKVICKGLLTGDRKSNSKSWLNCKKTQKPEEKKTPTTTVGKRSAARKPSAETSRRRRRSVGEKEQRIHITR